MKLEGKVAIVTGGARDLGRAISVIRLVAGNRHLHRYYNFAGRVVETVPRSLHPVSYTHLWEIQKYICMATYVHVHPFCFPEMFIYVLQKSQANRSVCLAFRYHPIHCMSGYSLTAVFCKQFGMLISLKRLPTGPKNLQRFRMRSRQSNSKQSIPTQRLHRDTRL